jgi:MarR family transcriptional regulator for hemolysin
LTRLVDRLCDSGLIERRADPNDRRAKRLHLTEAARPLLDHIETQVEELGDTVLAGIDRGAGSTLLTQLERTRENLKQAIADKTAPEGVKRYG